MSRILHVDERVLQQARNKRIDELERRVAALTLRAEDLMADTVRLNNEKMEQMERADALISERDTLKKDRDYWERIGRDKLDVQLMRGMAAEASLAEVQERCALAVEKYSDVGTLLLAAGEMGAQELRTAKAVVALCAHAVRAISRHKQGENNGR